MFGVDSNYYIGLRLLNENNEKAARNKFLICAKKGSYYCAQKSMQQLCKIGTVEEKNKACTNLLKKYNDDTSILTAILNYYSYREFDKIIEITNSCDIQKTNNHIIKYRMEALQQTNNALFWDELYRWLTEKQISTEQYSFCRDFLSSEIATLPEIFVETKPLFYSEQNSDTFNFNDNFDENFQDNQNNQQKTLTDLDIKLLVIKFRLELYKRNYTYTSLKSNQIIDFLIQKKIPASKYIASDLGKTFLYGNTQIIRNAKYFIELAEYFCNTPMEFYFWFYAGRFFDKGSLYTKETTESFINAINSTEDPNLKDNAIWYLFSSSMNNSVENTIRFIEEYAPKWKDPAYFEDFFDNLSVKLFASGKIGYFYQIYKAIENYASDTTVSQYGYIFARLAQEKLLPAKQETILNAFNKSIMQIESPYYSILARYNLKKFYPDYYNQNFSAIKESDFIDTNTEEREALIDKNADRLLSGYVYFGFPELIYDEWKSFDCKSISAQTSDFISDFLKKCSTGNDEYYTQSLRIACRSKSNLKLMYPKDFENIIDSIALNNDIEPEVLYALVRSESFFNPVVTSSAGAIGLTQLMETTGSDIARKMKISQYLLTDPETNLKFGSFYLKDLIRRCNNNYLLAFFSYNAGITRVRRWQKVSIPVIGTKTNLPMDLFLETLPYQETREYGRKLLSASVIYKWLYSKDLQNPENDYDKMIETILTGTKNE